MLINPSTKLMLQRKMIRRRRLTRGNKYAGIAAFVLILAFYAAYASKQHGMQAVEPEVKSAHSADAVQVEQEQNAILYNAIGYVDGEPGFRSGLQPSDLYYD